MTDGMIEKLARALIAHYDARPVIVCACLGAEPGEPACRCRMREARETVKAAILAMREAIHAAVDKVNPGESDYDDWWAASVKKQIDTALKEP